jgi:hypothetical protein
MSIGRISKYGYAPIFFCRGTIWHSKSTFNITNREVIPLLASCGNFGFSTQFTHAEQVGLYTFSESRGLDVGKPNNF